jgi:hypothetical protein
VDCGLKKDALRNNRTVANPQSAISNPKSTINYQQSAIKNIFSLHRAQLDQNHVVRGGVGARP